MAEAFVEFPKLARLMREVEARGHHRLPHRREHGVQADA